MYTAADSFLAELAVLDRFLRQVIRCEVCHRATTPELSEVIADHRLCMDCLGGTQQC